MDNVNYALWERVQNREFLFEKECYKACNSFCCRWDHIDFPRFYIPKGGTLFYLPQEFEYIKKYEKLPNTEIAELSSTLYDGKKISIFYTACNDDEYCNINFTRTLYCKLYPFFPVFTIDGELKALKYISIYDITSSIMNIETPCYIKSKKDEYIQLWKNNDEIMSIFKNPYLLFHFLVADIVYNNYVSYCSNLKFDINNKKLFWKNWELLYLKGELINKEQLQADLNKMYREFKSKYTSFEL